MSTFVKLILIGGLLAGSVTVTSAQTRKNKPAAAATKSPQESAFALFESGQDAHASGKLEEAVKLYSQALAADETLWQAQMQLTSAYYSLNRLPEARTSINKVLEQLKEFPESHELKQTASKAETLSGDIALASTQPVEAEAAYQRALNLNPANQRAHSGLAQSFIANNKFTEAVLAAKAALATGDDSALTYALLGNAYLRLKSPDDALLNLNEALKRESQNAQALQDRADAFLLKKDFANAAKDLQSLLVISKSTNTMLRLAGIYRNARQYDEAVKLYQQVAESEPNNQAANSAIAEILIESGKSENAKAQLESLIQADPKRADLHSQLALILVVSEPEKALEHYRAAAQIAPTNPNHFIGIASCLVKLKRFDEAIATLKPVLALPLKDDEAYPAHANYATALFELDDFANASREYVWLMNFTDKTKETKKTAVATYFLGVCLDKLKNFELALKAYQQFLTLATPEQQLEVEKVKLRLPSLERQIAQGQGIKNKQRKK